MDYDPFVVAHLVKFEKPQKVGQYGGTPTGGPTDYTYITDSQYDLLFDDGSSDVSGNDNQQQTYRANKVLKIGTVNENIVARASNMSLVINSSSLGAEAEATLTFTSSEIAGDVDLVEAGFQEGDKILFTKPDGLNNHNKHVRIEKFKNGGKTIVYTAIDAITTSSTPRDYTISLAAEEIVSLVADKASSTYTNYINREVYIYKVHINPETRAIIGTPFLIFKGITSGASISEKLESSEITWTLSSHWGDFVRVQGRLTDDATHRALKSDGSPDKDALIRPSYASDYGFIHSGTALNHIATYVGQETKYKFKKSGFLGMGSGRTIEYQVDVDRQVDLQFNPEARMLPVVYGVRKIGSFPVLVDTHKDRSDEIYKVDALCEGPVAGILDVHVDGNPSICLDASDFDSRSEQGANYDADFVEVICKGRADRGDTLGHYDAFTASAFTFAIPGMYFPDILGDVSLYSSTYSGISFSSSPTGAITTNTTGIRHRGTHTLKSPINADLTFHAGLADQNADNTLVNLAANNSFKIQNDYYDDVKIPYWSPSHRLLDTAYIVGRYTIADGETTIPDIEYVVRGRDPECYNYDGSYKQPYTRYFSVDAAHTAFPLGTGVTLHEASTNTAIGGSYTIVDKWFTYDVDGNKDHRFRFSPEPVLEDSNGNPITSFYMTKDSGISKWHMMTWDHSDRSGSPSNLATAIFPSVTTGTTKGLKITLGGTNSFLQEAFTNDNAQIGIRTTSIEEIMASTFTDADVTISGSSVIIDNISDFATNPGITQVTVKNAIHLGSGASSQDDAYNDMDITITQERNGIPYIQKRKIIDYDGGTQCAFLDSSLDWQFPLTTADTYKLGSVGDRRVTLNPAMQLLDYMTNERYGKGLDINEDIDVEKFKQAARECDTRSDVTVVFSSGSFTEGQKWRYPASGDLQWEGTVDLVESVGGKVQVTFTDVVGKLGVKWNDHRTFLADRLYWYDGCAYIASGGLITTKPTGSGKETSVSIYLSSNTTTTRAIDISTASADGNPLVKKYSTVTNSFTASGYSLYDSDNVKYWKYLGWDDASQRNVTRHQMNQVIDTNRALFENINQMLSQFNGMLQYSAGKYGLIVRGKKGTIDAAEQISDDDIIGTIKLSDKGLKSSKNFMSTSIVDPQNKFEGRSVTFFNSVYLKEDKGIQKKGSFNANGITNYFNTRFGLKQNLDESRFGLTIQFTMAPRGLLLQAGSVIELTYSRFGYNSKEFRITNLNFKHDGTVDVTADEHNDSAYVIEPNGKGHGAVEQVEVAQAPVSLPQPDGPTSLQCSQTRQGEIVLTWTNSTTFSSATHITEIYSSTVNDFENTTDPVALIGTSDTNIFHDLISEGSGNATRYYWIRYQVRTPKLNLSGTDFRNVPSRYNPAAPESGTHTGVEGIGQAAFAVRTLTLDPGVTSAFVYNNAGDAIETGNHSATDITATIENDSGTVTYVWTLIAKDGTESTISGQTDADYTYNAPTDFSDMPQTIKVVATDTVTDENNVVTTHTATAQVTYIGVRTVEDGYTVTATTPTFNYQASSLGTIDGVDTFETTFNVRRGGTALTFDNSATPAANTFQYGTITNITPANSVVPDFDDGATLAEKEKIHISDASGNFLTGTSVTQCFFDVPIIDNRDSTTVATSRIVLSKSLDGINARTVRLTAPHIVITYDSDGANPSQSAAYDITATPFNTTGTPKYRFTDGSTELQAKSTDNTYEYTPPSSYSDLPDNIVVELYEDNGQAILATDTITISGSKEGAAGADAVIIAYDNSAHAVPVSVTGTEVWTGSGGLFEVHEGGTELSLKTNGQNASHPAAADTGTFNLDITKVSGDTLTEPLITGAGSVGATIGQFNSNLTTLTKYRITAYIRGLDGTTYTRHIDVSLAPADQGETGDNGLRTVSGRLYYEKTTAGAPSAPTGTTFTFSTGLVSGTGINDGGTTNTWKNSPNTQEATSTNTYYTLTYYGVEAAANSSTVTVSYGTVKEHTSFSGVVTFNSGDFSKDGSTITSIDGGNIASGSTITAGVGTNLAGLTGRNANNTGDGSADTDVRIFAGSTFDNRNTAPFRVQQDGSFRAEFGSIGGFTIGEDTLISSNTDNPILTLGSDLTSNPEQQITLSSRDQDDFLMYAGIEVPADGVGVKVGDNPPFGVDSNGKVFMREFELKDSNNNVILDSDNLLGPAINAQITNLLKAGADSVPYADNSPNTGFKLVITSTQNIQIDAKIYLGYLRIFGLDKDDGSGNGYTIQNALDSIAHSITVKIEQSTNGSTWSTMSTTTFTGVKQAGYLYGYATPSLGTNDYWIDGEEYFARSHGNAFRAEVRKGFGALDADGNLSVQLQMQNKAAGTYYYRINTSTTGTRGVQFATRTYDHTQESWYVASEIYDLGYGTLNGTPTNAQMITNTRNFTIGTYSGSGTPGASYSIDENLTPPTVAEGKTFDDFLLLSGGTLSGTLTLNGNPSLSNVKRIDSAGQQIVLNAGESKNYATSQTNEYVYINAESGLEINSSPDNWLTTGWAGRHTTYIGKTNGDSVFPKNIEVGEAVKFSDGTSLSTAPEEPAYWHRWVYAQGDGGTDPNTPSSFYSSIAANTTKDYGQDTFYSRGSIEPYTQHMQSSDSVVTLYTMWVYNSAIYSIGRTMRVFRVDDEARLFVNSHTTATQSRTTVFAATSTTSATPAPLEWTFNLQPGYNKIQVLTYDHGGDHFFDARCKLLSSVVRFVPEREKDHDAAP